MEENTKAKSTKKIICYVAIALASVLLLVAIGTGAVKFWPPKKGEFDDYKNNVSNVDGEAELPVNPIDFASIQEKYSDVCAWIQIPGIDNIDYPILQSKPQDDDNLYLYRDVDGNKDRAGSIYIQKHNKKDFSDPCTLIYGHNMLNGSMFGKLYDGSGKQFCNEEFFNEHRTIFVYTPGHILEYEIISAFVYDNRHIMNAFNFDVEEEKMEFFNTCTNPKSLTKQVVEGATLETNDKIITLSTCTGNDNTRYLVVGKLISDTATR